MKVVQINAVYGFGSTGVIVKDFCEYLESHGNEVYPVYQRTSVKHKNGYCVGNILDWKWHALYTRLTGKQGYASILATKKLLKHLDQIKPDIVHLHNLHSNFVNIDLLLDYLREKNIVTVITLHDCWFFTGKCTHFIQCGCERWKDDCGFCPQLKNEVPSLFTDNTSFVLNDRCVKLNALPNVTFVGCSEWISNLARQSRIGNKNIVTIHNGIDTSIFTRKESKFRKKHQLENKFVILGFADKWANLENKIGVEKIISSLEDNDVILLVGCNGKNEKQFCNNKIITLPFVSNKNEMADIYNASNVFVNLTRFDNYPTVNMESVCCGTPVITFDVGGSGEMINTDNGFIVKTGDFDMIIQLISTTRKQTKTLDCDAAKREHGNDTFFNRYHDLYNEI